MGLSLHIENLSKKFGSHQILNSINLNIYPFEKIAILGANGSGKSTLLKIMAGFLYFDKGIMKWTNDAIELDFPDFSFSSPYIDLFENLSIEEHLVFHFNQKKAINNYTVADIITLGNFETLKHKQIKQLSSGIKQRFKNSLAIFTASEVLFLDEPCSNLDEDNTTLYQKLVKEYTSQRIVIIASNNPVEYDLLCTKEFKIENNGLQLLRNKQLWA